MGFRSARGGGASARFAAAEATLLRGLVGEVAELVGGEPLPADGAAPGGTPSEDILERMIGLSDSTSLPDDPVLARLLPDAYPDDEKAAGEFRRYTEESLRSGKVAAAAEVLATLPETGGSVKLSADQAQSWLRALNDVRLALGVRLDVSDDRADMERRAAEEGPQVAAALWVYDWLSILQETLVEALS